MRFPKKFPTQQQVVARLQAWDEAAYCWLAAAAGTASGLAVGRSAWFCGGYGLGMAAVATAVAGAHAVPSWLGIAACLFLAGVAHDNEDRGVARDLPAVEPAWCPPVPPTALTVHDEVTSDGESERDARACQP